MDVTHPGVKQILKNGALSVRRTVKAFARTAVDITLEQTVNADAASRSTGIAVFSQSDPSRRRWMVTHAVRSAIVGHLLSLCGMKSTEDVSKSLKPYRINKDNADLKKLIEGIENTMNPFTQEIDENLYCLTTGAKTADDIKTDLLSCMEKGKAWHKEFLDGCFADGARFEKPIPRRKIKNFASGAVVGRLTTGKIKIMEIQGTRDLFGRLLYLSTQENIDLATVFQHPLTPVPLALAHLDGSLNKTDKAQLLRRLEKMCESANPERTDVIIVDAAFFLHTMQSPPMSFGKIAEDILQRLCSMAPEVHFVCDVYKEPSIKHLERSRRGEEDLTFSITGPEQKRPRDWQKALKSPKFKAAFFRFLAAEWERQRYLRLLGNHIVFLGFDTVCYSYCKNDGVLTKTEVPTLACQHEEADTRLSFHLYHINNNHIGGSFVVRSNDTDVLVILTYHVRQMTPRPKVWLDVGLSSSNNRRYIDTTKLSENDVTECLPGFHAYTGCDVTASFMNKGKVRPLEIVLKQKQHQEAFAMLGQTLTIPRRVLADLEKFVCTLYGKSHMSDINDVRFASFQQYYAPRKGENPLEKITGVNPSSMAPCKSSLINKALRSNYVAYVWMHAHLPNPCDSTPEGHGWVLFNDQYHVKWFDCDQVPESITRVLGMDSSPHYMEVNEEGEMEPSERICDSDESDDEWE